MEEGILFCVLDTIGYACLMYVICMGLFCVGAIIWIVIHMCEDIGYVEPSNPICALDFRRCVYPDEKSVDCSKCPRHLEYEERKNAYESGQNGSQRRGIHGPDGGHRT